MDTVFPKLSCCSFLSAKGTFQSIRKPLTRARAVKTQKTITILSTSKITNASIYEANSNHLFDMVGIVFDY